MIVYKKNDLVYTDYEWTEPIITKLTGSPDRNLFKRYEGHEVLYMINYTCETKGLTSKEDAELIEKLLHESMPFDIKSQNSVYQWLEKELVSQYSS